jgi:hypothetical protein
MCLRRGHLLMPETTFFRLLKTPIDDKGDALAARIAALNAAGQPEETFTLDPTEFAKISGSPFAYWAEFLMDAVVAFPSLEPHFGRVIRGPEVHDLKESVRIWLEVPPELIGTGAKWVDYAKGGELKPYAPDVHLVVDFGSARDGSVPFRRPGDESDYFHAGLTYTQRTTSRLTLRVMNSGCLTSPKGPGIIPSSPEWLWYLMAVANSILFQQFIDLKVGAADAAARSYDLNILRDAPVPLPGGDVRQRIEHHVRDALDLAQSPDAFDETSHAFSLPSLLRHPHDSLLEASLALEAEAQAAQARLVVIQAEIDDIVFDLYGLGEADRTVVRAEMGEARTGEPGVEDEEETEEDKVIPPEDLPARVQNLLMWCTGVVFGRWDVRMALDPTLVPGLQGLFDPLPPCAPGALVGIDGLPAAASSNIAPKPWLRARENVLDLPSSPSEGAGLVDYPLPIAWDGILVDDPTHPSDIVTGVRGVLSLLWGDRAGAIEREACEILGFNSLRDSFRDPRKGFFPFHIKRYSKSRRKAPIYWLLQSERRNYGIWLYYHRLDKATLYAAGRDYADAKVALEETRLQELRQGLAGLSGSARKHREGEIEQQQKLVAEVTGFRKKLDTVALLNLPPDLNDGVVISIAPLWELVPWKEAQKTWEKLVTGEYKWSSMSKQMRERGLTGQ